MPGNPQFRRRERPHRPGHQDANFAYLQEGSRNSDSIIHRSIEPPRTLVISIFFKAIFSPAGRKYNVLSQAFFKLDKVRLIYYFKKLKK